jgi:hypothetical protein
MPITSPERNVRSNTHSIPLTKFATNSTKTATQTYRQTAAGEARADESYLAAKNTKRAKETLFVFSVFFAVRD